MERTKIIISAGVVGLTYLALQLGFFLHLASLI